MIPQEKNPLSLLRPGRSIHGHTVKRSEPVLEMDLVFHELEHEKTGARHIHIASKDPENVFAAAFKTTPSDSTGVAHILEHTVLCGSEKFPVRDPFFSMLKRSVNTFMNAFTSSDWTMYPFATQNPKDYFNLMAVYLDSVFFPLIDGLSFKQEGRRLEFEGPAPQKTVYKGVVYNEMKGAMSSPPQVMSRSLLNALFPDSVYRFNSGGDPAEIPNLSHEALRRFHRRHYHPGNSFFFTYGDFPLEETLKFIHDHALEKFDFADAGTDVAPQPRWDAPRESLYFYPLAPNEDEKKKCQVCVAWLTADITDASEIPALKLLNRILMGNAASPLRKALIDLGLGSDLCDAAGLDCDSRDAIFVCGLKDVDPSDAPEIEETVFKTLKGLADGGIDREMAESALHQMEFHQKEVKGVPYPHGIQLLLKISGAWFHGGDPLSSLASGFDRLREKALSGGFLEEKIRTHFIDNPHRTLFVLAPDREKEKKENEQTAAALEKIRKQLTPADIEKIQKDARALQKRQEEPEDISLLPDMALSDIKKSVEIILPDASGPVWAPGTFKAKEENAPVYYYNRPTSGILYFHGSASFSHPEGGGALPETLLPLAPFFCFALPRCGTRRLDYAQMAQKIEACSGGMGLSASARSRFDETGACLPLAGVGGKCLERKIPDMFDTLEALFLEYSFDDHARLKNLLSQYRAMKEAALLEGGHIRAISLSARRFSPALALGETWSGVSQLKFLKKIAQNPGEKDLASLARKLSQIGARVLSRERFEMALAAQEPALEKAAPRVWGLYGNLPASSGAGPHEIPAPETGGPAFEGWQTSSAVSFVAQSFPVPRMGHEDAPALSVISKMLRSLFLHREIREKGGAYGGFARYDGENGVFSFASYRDPHIVATLEVYEKAREFIRAGNYTEQNVKEGILQVCSETEKPHPPGPAAIRAFNRQRVSLTDDMRAAFKERLLSLDRRQILKAAGRHFAGDAFGDTAVISGEKQLAKANKALGKKPLKIFKI
ncbi:Peptidase M16 [Candidatus Desulfarcum epimagneticum]|uniref:Peptidase M16 n=1 Tax=uncultured Desulfobacteraceae bacterium TaxID=218296 RepID=A0A484HIA2_9BACT|nr:Peptidase M16 [uncultured Desulfobacteraceae bacterium]